MNNLRARLKSLKRTQSNASSFSSSRKSNNSNNNFLNVYGVNINKGNKYFVVNSGNRFSIHTMRGLLEKLGIPMKNKNNKNIINFLTSKTGKNPNAVLFKPLNTKKNPSTYKNFKLATR
jgi:hypothetical protein